MTPGGWLRRLVRTSSFRLTLLYTGLFTVSVLILFAMMLWWGSAYVAQQIDQAVGDELGEVQAAAAQPGSGGLQAVVKQLSANAAPGSRYLLEDASGKLLAGNMPPLPPTPGETTWHRHKGLLHGWPFESGVRGLGVRTAGGDFLFVGRNTFALNEMREMVARAFLWVLGTTLVLAVAGGLLMSLGLLRRVEAISRTSQEIVAGDLGRRIAVRGTDDEFDRLALSLNAMLDRIQALMEGLNQVSSDIAHDLRTPLTRLRQRLELARRRGHTVGMLHDALDGAIDDVDAILDTFAALLRIAQIEAQTRSAEFIAVDLSALLQTLLEVYGPVAEEEQHPLTAELAPGLGVRGDPELLTQMFVNLIENALRHTPAGSAIRLVGTHEGPNVVAEVRDTGPGIPPELRDKVFQRFFRMERSRTTPGTGLGLSLVGAVAGLHGLRVALLDNAPGLRVRLVFPLHARTDTDSGRASRSSGGGGLHPVRRQLVPGESLALAAGRCPAGPAAPGPCPAGG